MISFIIPAHNEQELLGRTLAAVHDAARAVGRPYEIIVANDSSDDQTGSIAREHYARVVDVNYRQIAATRNAGARAANGEILIFVDADTMITERALRAALRVLGHGVIGGGCSARFDGAVPGYAKVLERVMPAILYALRLAPGCFLFCTRQVYSDVGGFNEALYCAEEVFFAQQLKRRGRFVILREFVITSARKLRSRTAFELLMTGLRLALAGPQSIRKREGLEYWYGPRGS